jgi:tetratricopeptide (TPR) repeat protein
MNTSTEPPTPAPSVADLKSQGDELYSQGNYLAAIEIYSKGLSLEPNNTLLYHNRGLAYLKLSNFAELRSNCEAILQIDPTNIKALVNRSFAFNKLGMIPEAINDLRAAINLGADDPNLAEQLVQLEQQKHPFTVNQLKEQGNQLFKLCKYHEALACYTQALQLDPQNVTLYNNRGSCFLQLGMYSELKANSDAVLTLDPFNVKALVNRAAAWEQLGYFMEAIQDLRVALNLNPNDGDIFHRLSKLEKNQPQTQVVPPLVFLPQNPQPIVLVADPQHQYSEISPLLLSINSAHHQHEAVAPPMKRILWFQIPGLILSLGVLGFAIYQVTQSYDQYENWHNCKGNISKLVCDFRKAFSSYFFVQLIGAIIQTLNSAHGTFAFLFRSAKGLEIYGGVSTATIVWQAIQTIIFIIFSQIKSTAGASIPITSILGVVIGWVPIIVNILAVKLRFELLTWNLLTQFTFLDGCLCEPTILDHSHSHCTPHALVPSSTGCCQKIYRCTKCSSQWKRT